MDRTIRLDSGVLYRLGFRNDGGIWYHGQDDRLSIRLAQTCFYVSIFGFESGFPHPATVGELEKLYLDRTSKWLFSGFKKGIH